MRLAPRPAYLPTPICTWLLPGLPVSANKLLRSNYRHPTIRKEVQRWREMIALRWNQIIWHEPEKRPERFDARRVFRWHWCSSEPRFQDPSNAILALNKLVVDRLTKSHRIRYGGKFFEVENEHALVYDDSAKYLEERIVFHRCGFPDLRELGIPTPGGLLLEVWDSKKFDALKILAYDDADALPLQRYRYRTSGNIKRSSE